MRPREPRGLGMKHRASQILQRSALVVAVHECAGLLAVPLVAIVHAVFVLCKAHGRSVSLEVDGVDRRDEEDGDGTEHFASVFAFDF